MSVKCALIYFVLLTGISCAQEIDETNSFIARGEEKLSDKILKILEHYKQPDPIGLPPVFEVPEPFPAPDTPVSLPAGTLKVMNVMVHGLSRSKVVSVKVELSDMEVYAEVTVENLKAVGNYTLTTWLSRAQGPFSVNVYGMRANAVGKIGVERDGKLRVQTIALDVKVTNMVANFENLGFLGSVFQGVINSIGPTLFDAAKPTLLVEFYNKARTSINAELEKVAGDMQFPNSISPLDMVIADARKKVQENRWDPLVLKDYNASASIFMVTLSNSYVIGVSTFHRVGNITMKIENNTVVADFEIGTQKLQGWTHWEISALSGLMSRAGTASFSVDYISARLILGQPLDTTKRIQFRNLDLEMGNIQVRCDGAGTLDYTIEFGINILPNLLRYQIMDGIEGPLKNWLQKELDKVDVEEVIRDNVQKLDEMDASQFKLSTLLGSNQAEVPHSDDEFFNF